MSEHIGIFQGKQERHNKSILTTLYDNGPLSIWEITKKIVNPTGTDSDYKTNILHKTLSKRIRDLEKKGYVAKQKASSKWVLNFKGLIVCLILQSTPRPLGAKWGDLSEQLNGQLPAMHLRDFDALLRLSKEAKRLIAAGVINLDIIKNRTLVSLLLLQIEENLLDKILDYRGGDYSHA